MHPFKQSPPQASALGRAAITLRRRLLTVFSAGLLGTFPALGVDYGKLLAITAEAAITIDPPQIDLSWPLRTDLTTYSITRLNPDGTNSTTSLPGTATGFTDADVAIGLAYEYQITAALTNSSRSATAFVSAGIDLPLLENRGTLLLLIDSTIATQLDAEISRLGSDLRGDAWRVESHLIDPDAAPIDVRDLIIARHAASASTASSVRSVLLLGKIPVPYSGDHAPDSHSNHRGAWPADAYYGDVDGSWTDATVNNTSASRAANHNIPGDGKLDQTVLPSDVDLAVGRIDLSNLPSYAPLTEIDLLRRYLDKNHAYRQATSTTAKCALIDDHLSAYPEGFSAPPRAAFTAILGGSEVQDGDWHSVASAAPQLFGAGIGFGSYTSISGVTTTAETAAAASSVTFSLLFGSYFGDWDNSDNVLRAQLASAAGGLATMYSGRPIWQIQSLGHGETLGDVTRLTVNAQFSAPYPTGYSAYRTHVALMGDPTLRLFPVAPAKSAIAVLGPASSATVSWSPPDPVPDGLIGYHVYRCPDPNSQAQRLTAAPIPGHQFTDAAPLPAGSSYLVKTIVLQETASSRYQNASQASFADLTPGTSYATWSSTYFSTAESAPPLDDTDLDMLPNLLEYAIGTDPTKPDSGLNHEGSSAGKLNFSYTIDRLAFESAVEPQVSDDLIEWQTLTDPSAIQSLPHPTADHLRVIKLSLDRPASGSRRFIRLNATATSGT